METEILGILLGAVLPLYPLLFAIYQKIGRYDEIVEEFKKLRDEHENCTEEISWILRTCSRSRTVTGLYRGKFGGLEPLTIRQTPHA